MKTSTAIGMAVVLTAKLFLFGGAWMARAAQGDPRLPEQGWDECKEIVACGGLCDYKIVLCGNGQWYTAWFVTRPCPNAVSNPAESGGCSADQRKIVQSAFTTADKMLNRAIELLSKNIDNPSKNKCVSAALKNNFGWPSDRDAPGEEGIPRRVLKNLETLESKMSGRAETDCASQDQRSPNAETTEDQRMIRAWAPFEDSNHFVFYPTYFANTFDSARQATTIIHEMAHSWLHFSDEGMYSDRAGYPGRPLAAVEHPDSYAHFALDIAKCK